MELSEGLNVLSGGTGAGKSVLLAALALVTGARAKSDWIRPGADRAAVEAFFRLGPELSARLETLGVDCEAGELHLKREIRPDGRGQAWCDGFPVTVRRLAELGALLLERQDQHAQLALADPRRQLELLDRHARCGDSRSAYQEQLNRVRELRREEEALDARLTAVRRDEDYLRWQLEEIDALAPLPEERQTLEQRERRLRNASRLQETYHEGLLLLEEGASPLNDGIQALTRILERVERLGDELAVPELAELAERLAWLARVFRERTESLSLEAGEADALAERLGRLSALERKHGRPLAELCAWAEEQRQLLEQLVDQDRLLEDRRRLRRQAEADLSQRALALSLARRESAALLGAAWQERLALLGLERASLRLNVEAIPDEEGWVQLEDQRYRAGELGIDKVEILVRTNPDLPEGGLGEVPSGGELSRIAFARHLLPEDGGDRPVLVLDEVDAGIGADLAVVMAGQLRDLARRRQILAVTHQAPLAAAAHRQFCVRKDYQGSRTRSQVLALNGEERLAEITRMLGDSAGDEGSGTRDLAEALLARAGGI